MILSDGCIKKRLSSGSIIIEPCDLADIQPASIDVHLGTGFRVFRNSLVAFIDPTDLDSDITELVETTPEEPFILHPGEFALGTTMEKITLPDDILGRLEGKSSLGRLGLLIHSTAGYVDPGWSGDLTLELSNVSNLPILLRPGMKIGQMAFEEMSTPAEKPYNHPDNNNHYQDQSGPTPSAGL